MASKNNKYFDHDTSQITENGAKLLFNADGDAQKANRQIAFTDPQMLGLVVSKMMPAISNRYRTNSVLLRQMSILRTEMERYVYSNYKQAFLERLVIGADTGMMQSFTKGKFDRDSAQYTNNPYGYNIQDLYIQLIASWPKVALSRGEVVSLNESTRSLLAINIEERKAQPDESFIAGALFTNSPASKIPDSIRRAGVPSYTGVDITVVATMGPFISAIDDIKTITYSVHRQTSNVFAMGNTNRKGIVRGPRTCAGSIICTVRLDDPMMKLHPQWMTGETNQTASSDPHELFKQTIMTDQLPMFDLLVTFQNELGYASVLSVYGINITDVGQVMSIADNEIEMTLTYGAIDVDIMRYVGYDKAGNIAPYDTEAYKNRRRKIILGDTVANNPYINPQVPDPVSFGGFQALL